MKPFLHGFKDIGTIYFTIGIWAGIKFNLNSYLNLLLNSILKSIFLYY